MRAAIGISIIVAALAAKGWLYVLFWRSRR
jgi:hypothetical protein